MGGVAAALIDSSITEVEVGPMVWRIRRVCSADLAKAGIAQLLAIGPEGLKAATRPQKAAPAKRTTAAEKARLMEAVEASFAGLAANPGASIEAARSMESVIVAGVCAVADKASSPLDFEDIRFVLDSAAQDKDAGIVAVTCLPRQMRAQLATAIIQHSTDQGGVESALARFR